MRVLIFAMAFLAMCSVASAEPCKSTGSLRARELGFDLSDPGLLAGMNVSFQLGLLPASFPGTDIAEAKLPCPRGTFMVGNSKFEILGDDELSPQRWAKSASEPGRVAFVATVPRPQAASDWAEKYKKKKNTLPNFGPGDWMQVLVIAQGEQRSIFAYYDDTLDDKRLKTAFAAALSGQMTVKARFNVTTRATTAGNGP